VLLFPLSLCVEALIFGVLCGVFISLFPVMMFFMGVYSCLNAMSDNIEFYVCGVITDFYLK
jgi:hypothetical protein